MVGKTNAVQQNGDITIPESFSLTIESDLYDSVEFRYMDDNGYAKTLSLPGYESATIGVKCGTVILGWTWNGAMYFGGGGVYCWPFGVDGTCTAELVDKFYVGEGDFDNVMRVSNS